MLNNNYYYCYIDLTSLENRSMYVHEVDYYSDGYNNNIIVMRSWKRSNFPNCMGTL